MKLKRKKMTTQYSDHRCKCRYQQAIRDGGKIYWTPIFCDTCKELSHLAGVKVITDSKCDNWEILPNVKQQEAHNG